MKRNLWTSLAAVVVAATLAATAPAWSARGMGPGGGGHGDRHHGGMRGFGMNRFQGLDLSASQRERIDAIQERQQRRGIQAHAELETAELDLRKLMQDDSPDLREINTQIDRTSRMRAELQKQRVAAMLEARDVLTDAQRRQLREMRPGPGSGRRGDRDSRPNDSRDSREKGGKGEEGQGDS